MGYINHHAIMVVGSGYPEAAKALRDTQTKAIELFEGRVTPIVPPLFNSYETFFVPPDGSKEGWEPSDEYDTKRKELIDFINSLAYDDGSNAVQHIEFWLDEDGDCGIDSHYEGCKIDDEDGDGE